ncbi:MAG: hypothetical protein IJ067_03440 [Prevotella sp.]|nr:hypothetical protein [Prevotella sp.]
MQTSTIILMLVGIVAVLTALVVVLLWQMHRKDEDIKQKNDVIIHEVRRNQSIIDKAVAQGINRAALFTLMCAVLMAVTFTACTNQNDNPVAPDTPQQPEELADYTIIYYGHGGGNLDVLLMQNIMDFSFADEEAYKNVNICAQYKFSSLKSMEEYIFYSDGMRAYFSSMYPIADNWGSTLDATYGQLRFDQLTGWSRWLKVNQQKPNEEYHTGFLSSMFDIEVGNE